MTVSYEEKHATFTITVVEKETEETTYRYSDTNGEGIINLKDVTLLRRYLAGGWGVQLRQISEP